MKKKKFKLFFKQYAKNVDNADGLAFWKLCDVLIFEIIKSYIPLNIGALTTILDAGGGTGRWIVKLTEVYKCRFINYDLSEDMLSQAEKNIKSAGLESRVSLVRGDLCDMGVFANASIDYIISIYNPISFIYNTHKAIKEVYRVLKNNGKVIIMGQGYYNAIASKINNFIASAEELSRLEKEYRVNWNEHMPELVTYSKESMEKLLLKAGFTILSTYGIPVFVQPGPEDWDPENKQKSRISKALEDKEFFRTVIELEMAHNSKPSVANRGMNILIVAQKNN